MISEDDIQGALADALKWARMILRKPIVLNQHKYECSGAISKLHMYGGALDGGTAWKLFDLSREANAEVLSCSLFESLAQSDPQRAEPILREAMWSADRTARYRASGAWLHAHGMPSQYEASDAVPRSQSHDWSPEVHYIMVLVSLLVQVENGGFSQWITNGFGRKWRLTIEASRAVGALETALMVEQAVALIRAGMNLGDDELEEFARTSQGEDIKRELEPLDRRFYEDDPDRLDARMAEFMLRHRHSFTWFDAEHERKREER